MTASASRLARGLAAVVHLAPVLVTLAAALLSVIAERASALALLGWLVPLGCWLALRRAEPFAATHALASLELRLTLLLFFAGLLLLALHAAPDEAPDDGPFTVPARALVLGLCLFALCVGEGACSLVACLAAARGQPFRYPMALPLFGLYPWGDRTGFERRNQEA